MVLIIWEQHNLKRLFSCHQEKGETALHLAVLLADRTSLHILDFLAQNWSVCYGNLCYTSVCVCVCVPLCLPACFSFSFLSALMLIHRHQRETRRCTTAVYTTRPTVWSCCWEPEPTHTSVIHTHTHTHTCIMYLSELSFISWASTVSRGYLMSFW